MPFDIKAAIKKPWVKYGLIAVGVIGAFYIFRSASSSSTTDTTSGSTDTGPNDAAIAQTQIQAGAAAASQSSAQSFQLQQQQESDTTNLSALGQNLAAQLHMNDSNNTTSVALSNIQLQGLQSQLAEASHVNDNETAVYLNGQNTTAGVAKNGQVQAKQGQTIATVGTIAVAAIAAFF
jgi:hypothetical protein